jgi:formate dehydrogenase major subunit
VEPPSPHLKSEVAIVCGMAKATLPNCGIDWDFFVTDYNRIRDKIEQVFPQLFADFNERVRRPGGFHLTNLPRQRVWETPTGRANFMLFHGVSEDDPVSDPAMLRLATLRSHDQYNTTVYSLDDRYRGVFGGRMVVFMNEGDMRARDIAEGDLVELESLADNQGRVVRGFWAKTHNIAPGSIGAYYPETNPLLPLTFYDVKSGTPAAKSIPVLVRHQTPPASAR